MPNGELFGRERLLATLALAAGRSAEADRPAARELAVRDPRGQRPGDDVAIVVVPFQPELRDLGAGPLTPNIDSLMTFATSADLVSALGSTLRFNSHGS